MKKNDLSEKIMHEIARQEKRDILTSIFVIWPGIIMLLIIALVSTNKSLGSLSSYGFFDIFIELDHQNKPIFSQFKKAGELMMGELKEGYLVVSTSSSAAVVFLSKKSKLHNLRVRIKEIAQYLPEDNFSISKINK